MEDWGNLIFDFAVLAVFILIVTVVAFGIISGLGAVFAHIAFEKFTTGISSACVNGYAEIEDFSLSDDWNIIQVYPDAERMQDIVNELNEEEGMIVFSPLFEALRNKVQRVIDITNTTENSCNSQFREGTGQAIGSPCLCLIRAPSILDLNLDSDAYNSGEVPVPLITTKNFRNLRIMSYAPNPLPKIDSNNGNEVIPYYISFLKQDFHNPEKSDYAVLKSLDTIYFFTPVSLLIGIDSLTKWPLVFIDKFEACTSMNSMKCGNAQPNFYNNSAILAMKEGMDLNPVFMIVENSQASLITFEKSESSSTFEPVYMSTPS
ncbi:MAG: hypothetical protein GOU97_00865 [Nanoarchaeota archaeon]|nr:hypothetical protein [Nanoarchaeota archaeon]